MWNIARERRDKFGINKCDRAEWKITRLTQMVVAQGSRYVHMYRMHANMKVSEQRLRYRCVRLVLLAPRKDKPA